jgi:hypothetical protein
MNDDAVPSSTEFIGVVKREWTLNDGQRHFPALVQKRSGVESKRNARD